MQGRKGFVQGGLEGVTHQRGFRGGGPNGGGSHATESQPCFDHHAASASHSRRASSASAEDAAASDEPPEGPETPEGPGPAATPPEKPG